MTCNHFQIVLFQIKRSRTENKSRSIERQRDTCGIALCGCRLIVLTSSDLVSKCQLIVEGSCRSQADHSDMGNDIANVSDEL